MQEVTQYIIYAGIISTALTVYYFVFIDEQPTTDHWLELPYLNEYLRKHPECKSTQSDSVKCCHCFSEAVSLQPLAAAQDRRYEHYCSHCNKTLFRSRSLF